MCPFLRLVGLSSRGDEQTPCCVCKCLVKLSERLILRPQSCSGHIGPPELSLCTKAVRLCRLRFDLRFCRVPRKICEHNGQRVIPVSSPGEVGDVGELEKLWHVAMGEGFALLQDSYIERPFDDPDPTVVGDELMLDPQLLETEDFS